MKYSRRLSTPIFVVAMGISIACGQALCAQINVSNECCLKIDLTNAEAVLTITDQPTNVNGPFDVFFKTNFADAQGWTWLLRCPPGQTSLVMSNLPPDQCFYLLGVTNAIRPGFTNFSLPPEDDNPSSNAILPFTINFFGAAYSNLWVNNNGNVTFDTYLNQFTPTALNQLKIRIIAPYWGDVDTQNTNSSVVTYGSGMVGTNNAFGVNWVNVGYYQQLADKLVSCQLVIIDRSSDPSNAPGDFDMEFNYFKVQWEWGAVSTGSPARVGYSDGTNDYELPGSGVEGAFLDTNGVTGLIYNSTNSTVPGRYVFYFRNGQPWQPSP
ncbi:MAG: nidogen-like domain-containing protein [Verrucomicrobiia bacterium]